MKILIIVTMAGLGNRFREMLSFREYALSKKFDKIYFIWHNTKHCSGDVYKYFIIPDMKILNYDEKQVDEFDDFIISNVNSYSSSYSHETKKIKYEDNDILLEYVGGRGKHRNHWIIDPKIIVFDKEFTREVDLYINEHLGNDFYAIHLRSPENTIHIDHELIKDFIISNKDKNIYIASDYKTYHDMYRKYGNVIIRNNKTKHHYSRSAVCDALFDILVCSKSIIFIGTPNRVQANSSFSNFIYGVRGVYEKAVSLEYTNKHYIHSVLNVP
jgi:hypothetical protein